MKYGEVKQTIYKFMNRPEPSKTVTLHAGQTLTQRLTLRRNSQESVEIPMSGKAARVDEIPPEAVKYER